MNSSNRKLKKYSNLAHQRLKKQNNILFLAIKGITTMYKKSMMSLKIHSIGKQSNKVKNKPRGIKNKEKQQIVSKLASLKQLINFQTITIQNKEATLWSTLIYVKVFLRMLIQRGYRLKEPLKQNVEYGKTKDFPKRYLKILMLKQQTGKTRRKNDSIFIY